MYYIIYYAFVNLAVLGYTLRILEQLEQLLVGCFILG
jgi:hypothetical protein